MYLMVSHADHARTATLWMCLMVSHACHAMVENTECMAIALLSSEVVGIAQMREAVGIAQLHEAHLELGMLGQE